MLKWLLMCHISSIFCKMIRSLENPWASDWFMTAHNSKSTILGIWKYFFPRLFTTRSFKWSRKHLNPFGRLTFFGHCVSALARWPLTKSKYSISLSILGMFVWFAHQNSCTHQAYSKTAIKTTIFYDRYILYHHIYLNMTRKRREQNCSNRQTARETVCTYVCTNCVWLM
jgi:hypothetical protein